MIQNAINWPIDELQIFYSIVFKKTRKDSVAKAEQTFPT